MEDLLVPSESRWRRMIERDVESMLVKGFEREVNDSWFDFIDEMRNLLHELKDFFSTNYVSVQSFSARSRRTSSEPNLEVSFTQNLLANDDQERLSGSHHVCKIIESHESIIRKQRTLATTTREGDDPNDLPLSSYWVERNECINAMERRIQDATAMLESLPNHRGVGGNRTREKEKRRIPKPRRRNDTTTSRRFEEEIEKVREERDGLCFQISVIEDTYQLLLRGVMRDFCCDEREAAADESDGSNSPDQILQHYLESTIREDIHVVVFQETVEQWKMSRAESVRGSENPLEDFRWSPVLRDCTESLLREDIYMVIFQETVKQWKKSGSDSIGGLEKPQEDFCCSLIKRDCTESLLREDIYMVIFQETVKQWKKSGSDSIRGLEKPQEDFCCSLVKRDYTESLLREDIYMVIFQETIKQWKKSGSDSIRSLEKPQEDFCCSLVKRDYTENLLREDIYTLVFKETIKQWKTRALQQLYTSKELLGEPEESLELSDGGGESDDNSSSINILRTQEENTLELEDDDHDHVLAIIKRFRFLVDNFEVVLQENLENKFLRVEALKHQVDTLTQPMACIRTKKLLYEKAFISRSRNLKLAETEVDLLGDQVDLLGDQVETLLSLLKRIYIVLNRNATVLSTYFEVNGILKSIKMELNDGRSN